MSNTYAYFPLARCYARDESTRPHLLKEPGVRGRSFGYTERHLQAVWFDPKWRPRLLVTSSGEKIEVEFPGRWNLEAGPDFLGATLLVGPDRRRISGDVEIHIFPAGWKNHHHDADPRYRNVCVHVTYFDGQLDDGLLPPGTLQVSLRDCLKADPAFAFEHIDVSAYPYAGRADVPPCRMVLAAWPVAYRLQLLAAAGHERMRLKAARFSEAISVRGIDQVLYEAIMGALGYQHNKLPFLNLASRLPVERLRHLAGGNVLSAYALLAGMSGLLPVELNSARDDETRLFIRSLWDVWWKLRHQLPEPLEHRDWHLHGVRPLNHPLRRLMAGASIFLHHTDGYRLLELWYGACGQGASFALEPPEVNYWTYRSSLGGNRKTDRVAIIGRDRLDAITMNILIPMAAACGFDSITINRQLETIKPEPLNHIMKQVSYYLLGPDHPSSSYRTAIQRQGLLQIFHDYCINDRSMCSRCAFPDLLAAIRRDGTSITGAQVV
jgi:Protein of unknown function (DUF2851)